MNGFSNFRYLLIAFVVMLFTGCSGGGSNDDLAAVNSRANQEDVSSCLNDKDCDGLIDSIDPDPESGDINEMRESKLFSLKSFDGSKINCKLLLPAGKGTYPCIMFGHGWAMYIAELEPRARILQQQGYACLLWDARGWGESEGTIRLDLPEYEVRDIIMLINWLGAQSFVIRQGAYFSGESGNKLVDFDFNNDGVKEKDEIPGSEANDFVLGMMGRSYGGAAILLAASYDKRIDALIPEITWNNLRNSLYPEDSLKKFWALGFYVMGVLDDSGIDSNLSKWIMELFTKNDASASLEEGFALRSPSSRIDKINVPCMFIQGQLDTVFELNQAISTFESIRSSGNPAKMYWPYGGHDTLPLFRDEDAVVKRIILWMDKYLKGEDVDTGPELEYDIMLPDNSWTIQDGIWPEEKKYDGYYLHSKSGSGLLEKENTPDALDYSGEESGLKVLSLPVATSISDIHSPIPDVILYDLPLTSKSYLSDVFEEDVEMTGQPKLDIWLSSSGKDITFYFKLIDVAPDNSSKLIKDGFFLKDFAWQTSPGATDRLLSHPVKPFRLRKAGEPELVSTVLGSFAHYVRKGHRIKLVIATSDFSFMNSRIISNGFIWHDAAHVSKLYLPSVKTSGPR